MISGVPSAMVATIWPKVRGLVKKALDAKRYAPEHILERLVDGRMQLWVVGDGGRLEAIAVTEINVYPRSTWAGIVALAGAQREAWLPYLADIEAWAAANGCCGVEAFGRRGWLREPALKAYRLASVVIEKEFAHVADSIAA